MTNNTGVEIYQSETNTLLAHYGSRKEIREFMERIRKGALLIKLKGGESRRLVENELMALANACLPYGFIPGVDVIPMVDRSGNFTLHYAATCWQKGANARLREEGGGNYWPQFEMITDPAERQLILVPAGAIAFRCKLYDTPTIRAYTALVAELNKIQGMTPDKLIELAGSRPYTEGIGWYLPTANTKHNDESYPPVERAKKRAFKQALKARFSLEFQDNESDGNLPDDFTGQLGVDRNQTPVHERAPIEVKADDYTDPAFIEAEIAREAAQRTRDSAAVWGEH